SDRAASRSDGRTRISRAPAAVKSSSGESIASVSRYPQSIPFAWRSPQTTSASGSLETTVRTTASPGSMARRLPVGKRPSDGILFVPTTDEEPPMRELLLIPLEDVVVFPNMTVTLSVDVGDETEVLLVPRHDGSHAAVGTVA